MNQFWVLYSGLGAAESNGDQWQSAIHPENLNDPNHRWLRLSVKDSDPELNELQIENLFRPFTQVDTSMTRKHGCTGLALAVSRRRIRPLGGDIVIRKPCEGSGCEFVLAVPVGATELPTDLSFVESLTVPIVVQDEKPKLTTASLKGVRVRI